MAQFQKGRFPFTQLTDVPNSYVGLANRIVSVKGTQDGLETIAPAAAGVTTFLALTDTPASYFGAAGNHVMVNLAENALIFTPITPTSVFNLQLNQEAAPGASTATPGAVGALTGAYQYRVTFVTALGETEAGTVSNIANPVAQQINLTGIPVGSALVTARNIYRTTSGGSNLATQFVATIPDNATLILTDNLADGGL